MRDMMKSAGKLLGWLLVFLLVAGTILYVVSLRVVTVGHDAMAPNILAGDRVLVWKSSDLRVGDMVLCTHPREDGFVIGRVYAQPGHRITLERGGFAVDGRVPDRNILGTVRFRDPRRPDQLVDMTYGTERILGRDIRYFMRASQTMRMSPIDVEGGLFLLSDNRTYPGEDSRTFGAVDPELCVGKVFMRLTAAEGAPPELGNGMLDLIR